MKKIIFFILSIPLSITGLYASSDSTAKSKWGLQLSGYINPHAWVDTRQTIGGRDGQLMLWPKKPILDANGKDTLAAPSFNMLAITSRFSISVSTPDILGALATGFFEADFSGSIEMANNSLRLRHGYIQLDWGKQKLLFGQTWHPLVVHEIMPSTAPLNTGAPFHPYARHMQVRYTSTLNNFRVIGVAVAQRDNSSDGPSGISSTYLRNAVIPNLHLQLQYVNGPWLLGAAGDFKVLKPRLSVHIDTLFYKTNTLLPSYTATFFGKYAFSTWDIKLQALWAQNQSENLLIGGYAESPIHSDNTYSYTNSNTFSSWLNISKTVGKWRPVLFLGYTKNLGFSKDLESGSTIFGRGIKRGEEIDYVWRIQPRLIYIASERFHIYSDIEYTVAGYGNGTPNEKGVFSSSSGIANTRFMLGAFFYF